MLLVHMKPVIIIIIIIIIIYEHITCLFTILQIIRNSWKNQNAIKRNKKSQVTLKNAKLVSWTAMELEPTYAPFLFSVDVSGVPKEVTRLIDHRAKDFVQS